MVIRHPFAARCRRVMLLNASLMHVSRLDRARARHVGHSDLHDDIWLVASDFFSFRNAFENQLHDDRNLWK